MRKYICYTDGSYQSSLDAGGGSSIILNENGQIEKILYNGLKHTTNNRMEIMAVLETLRYFVIPTELQIISDSQYVVETIQNHRVEDGIKNNDLSKKNLDLGFPLVDLLYKHKVTMIGTKGHAGNKGNEEADKGCTFAARCYNLKKDV